MGTPAGSRRLCNTEETGFGNLGRKSSTFSTFLPVLLRVLGELPAANLGMGPLGPLLYRGQFRVSLGLNRGQDTFSRNRVDGTLRAGSPRL